MNCQELYKLIKKGEDSTTQFKAKIVSPNALSSEICSFGNTEGGMILIGISDKGEIIGVENINKLNQIISNTASHKIDPPINVLTENIICNNKLIVIIKIARGDNKSYAANKTDYWIKVGADKRRASREELKRLMQESGSIYADETAVPATNANDLDIFIFKDFYEKEYGLPLDPAAQHLNQLLSNLKLMKDKNLTLAGVLLFAKWPEKIKPQFILLSYVPKLKIPYRGIGSGIRRMISECKSAGIGEPQFFEDKDTQQFKVIFSRKTRS